MKKTIASVFVTVMAIFFCLGLTKAFAHEGEGNPECPVRIYIWALVGPHTSNPSYPAWASNQVWKIYTTGAPTEALGYRLNATDVTQPVSLVSNSVWYAVRVLSPDSSMFFSPTNLIFVGNSSDNSNALGKTNYFNNPAYVYTDWAYGILHGPGGPRMADTVIADGSYWGNTNINEFIFIGAMSKFFTYSSSAQQSNVVATLNSMPDFFTTGTWQFHHDGHMFHASKTLRLKGDPFPGILTDPIYSDTHVRVGLNAGTNDTWIIQHSQHIMPANWHDMWTANAGDMFLFDKTSPETGFWRAILQ